MINKIFKNWNAFEICYFVIGFIAILTTNIICKTSFVYIFSTLMIFFAILLQSKGIAIAQIFFLISGAFYCYISYLQGYYGEMMIYVFIQLPLYIYAIFSWLKNKDGGTGTGFVKLGSISKKEWIILLSLMVPIFIISYFVLQTLHTKVLILSTFSILCSLLATYLMARRTLWGYIFFMTNDIVIFTMWLIASLTVSMSNLAWVVSIAFFMVNDCYGLINWFKEKKKQDLLYNQVESKNIENELSNDTKK